MTLTPKALAVLCHLVERAGQLVTKEDLLADVWPETVMGDGILKVYIGELRKVLLDDPKAPRYIETLHRRGYRFIAPLTTATQPVMRPASRASRQDRPTPAIPHPIPYTDPAPDALHLPPPLVGREAELEQLHDWVAQAARGARQLVFITGEAGIGKTTLVDALLESLELRGQRVVSDSHKGALFPVQTLAPRRQTLDARLWVAHGQCVEHYGAGEAYLPILEALGRLCRAPGGQQFITLLRQYAPTWLVQMPALLTGADREALQREVLGATREWMLREMAEAVEILAADRLLILRLEDLQWSDYATLDLLGLLGRRRETARLVVIGTYRPVDVIGNGHPLKALKQELLTHGQCVEVDLEFLRKQAVEEYLAMRLRVGTQAVAPLQELAQIIYERTEGNPLFMVNVVDSLIAEGVIAKHNGQWQLRAGMKAVDVRVPETLRQMIGQQIERLPLAEQQVLEAASVAGVEFTAAAAAAGLQEPIEHIEEQCDGLVRRGRFLRSAGISEWPDRTVTARYGFIHALYQEVLNERIASARYVRLHQRIGEREELAYGEQVGEIAAALAIHFAQGRDYRRAVKYLYRTAVNATRRHANQEALRALTKGMELLRALPDTPERMQQELRLQTALGQALMATRGYAAPGVEEAFARARELCRQIGETPWLFVVLAGLWGFYVVRAQLQTAYELAEQLLRLAYRRQEPALLTEAHFALGCTLLFRGELGPAREHLEEGVALEDPQQRQSRTLRAVQDPATSCCAYAAWALWFLGYADQAVKRGHETLTRAQELGHPFNLVFTLDLIATLHLCRGEARFAQERAEELLMLATDQEYVLWSATGTIIRGWALARRGQEAEGIAQIHQGLATMRETGTAARSYCLVILTDAQVQANQVEEGLTTLATALAEIHSTGECLYEAELYRLKGELLLKGGMQGAEYRVEQGTS